MVVEMRFSLFGLANLQGNPFHRETKAEGYGPKVQITVWEQVEHFKQTSQVKMETRSLARMWPWGQLTYTSLLSGKL